MALRGIRRFMPTWRMVRSMSSQQKDSGNLTKHIQDMLKTLKQRTQKEKRKCPYNPKELQRERLTMFIRRKLWGHRRPF